MELNLSLDADRKRVLEQGLASYDSIATILREKRKELGIGKSSNKLYVPRQTTKPMVRMPSITKSKASKNFSLTHGSAIAQ